MLNFPSILTRAFVKRQTVFYNKLKETNLDKFRGILAE
jgi:hypothetical protein